MLVRRLPALAVAVTGLSLCTPALASSHREAPFITSVPKADNTDVYAFRSYEAGRDGYVTLIANFQPLQVPGAGPNFYMLAPDVLYEIHVDNDGSSKPGVSFQFRFSNTSRDAALAVGDKMVAIPLINFGQIQKGDDSKLNTPELFNASIYRGGFDARPNAGTITDAKTGSGIFHKPVDNIGQKSIPDYEGYARQYVYDVNIPNCGQGRIFVGQRKDPFVVNVAEIFDLVNLNPVGPMDQGKNALAGLNVTTFAVEAPIKCLAGSNNVIGVWSTASMRRDRVGKQAFLNKAESEGAPDDWVQVSRLGMPLVNEVVIGLKDKDRFNSSRPVDDAQFLTYVTNPTLPKLLETLFASAGVKAPATPRDDLVTVFLQGVPGLNANGGTSEMLRLNVTIPPVAAAQQKTLGVLDGDTAGFPNGRRLGDDVVDIELRVAMGALLPADKAPSGKLPYTDGAAVNASMFDQVFPYVKSPLAGSPMPTATK